MPDYSRDFSISYDEDQGSCTISFRCFDTPNVVTVFGAVAGHHVESLLLMVRMKCLELHRLWSFSLPDSDVARINGSELEVDVNPETARLIKAMKDFNAPEPLFDFTIGPASYLWKHAKEVPSASSIEQALAHVGADKVDAVFDDAPGGGEPASARVTKADSSVRVDVGGAAKGFVADWIADFLRAGGVTSAKIDLGGNLYMLGKHPSGRPWRVSVRMPDGMSADAPIVEVADRSVVTSGTYERFAEIGGKRYHHVIDPRKGRPSEIDLVSATVVSGSSLEADMLATTALLAGAAGLADLAARHPSCEFVALSVSGNVLRYNGGHEITD